MRTVKLFASPAIIHLHYQFTFIHNALQYIYDETVSCILKFLVTIFKVVSELIALQTNSYLVKDCHQFV